MVRVNNVTPKNLSRPDLPSRLLTRTKSIQYPIMPFYEHDSMLIGQEVWYIEREATRRLSEIVSVQKRAYISLRTDIDIARLVRLRFSQGIGEGVFLLVFF